MWYGGRDGGITLGGWWGIQGKKIGEIEKAEARGRVQVREL